MHHPVRQKRTAVFFAPDISDVSTVKRAEAFLAHGYQLQVFGFRRDNYNRDFEPAWPYTPLGRTQDRRYGRRIAALLAAIPRVIVKHRALRRAAFYYARNIDQLLLALLARLISRRPARVIYEVLDVQPAFVGGGWKSQLLRRIERFALRHVDLLVVSSPGFLRHYFQPLQGYRKPWFLLENKLPADFAAITGASRGSGRRQARKHAYRWVVGYCGLIRGQDTLDLILRLAHRLQGLVLFKFRGIFTTVDRQAFAEAVAGLDNVVYEGDYVNPRDLEDIYSDLDFAWAIDLEHQAHNSRWLLPCRFYEAGYFGVPCLTVGGFEVGRLVSERRIGWNFGEPYEDELVRFFMTLTETEYQETRQRLLALPDSDFVAGEDTSELISLIDQPEAAQGL
ncbi:MAG: glycosyltransferase [Ferrovibrio sp.]